MPSPPVLPGPDRGPGGTPPRTRRTPRRTVWPARTGGRQSTCRLEDPYQAPEGYPIKASARYGLYYTPGSDLYRDTLPELWLSSEEVAQANGFTKAD